MSAAPRPFLVCLPHGGGVAAVYASWHAAFREQADVVAIEYPGHGTRAGEGVARSLDELLADVLVQLGAPGRRPLAIFGHSFGATVGYELARTAQSSGWEVLGLIPSAARPPHVPPPQPLDASQEGAAAAMRELGDLPSVLIADDTYLSSTSRLVAADNAVLSAYTHRPAPLLSAPVLAMGGDADPVVEMAALARWPELSASGGEVLTLPGGHFYYLRRRASVIGAISGWLTSPARHFVR
jgi:surfactin synthase thioesterase subunit